jgi:acetyl-CoA synthetase
MAMEDLSATASIQSDGVANMAEPTLIDDAMYRAMYEASIRDPETFWGEHGKRIDWINPYTRVKDTSFA